MVIIVKLFKKRVSGFKKRVSGFQKRVFWVKSDIEDALRRSDNFNDCLEEVYYIVDKFDDRCLPLTISQVIRLKGLHHKIWGYPVDMVNDWSDEDVRVWREQHV